MVANDPTSQPAPSAVPPGSERKLLADTGKLSSATGLAHAINMVGGVVIASLLLPAHYAIWKYLQQVLGYTAFANLGATNGIDRVCPALISKGKTALYRAFIGSSLTFSMTISLGLALLALGGALLLPPGPTRFAAFSLVVLILLQPFFQHGEAALAVEKRFGTKARVVFGSTLFRIVFSIAAAWAIGLEGVIAVYAVTLVLATWYMFAHSRLRNPCRMMQNFSPSRWPRGVIRVGLPISLLAFSEQIFLTADKWLVGGLFGETAGGWYWFAVFPFPILMLIPSALRQVVSIDVYDKFTQTKHLEPCREVFERSVMAIALSSPLLIGAVYIGLPWLIHAVLPKYIPSIPALKLHAVLIYPILISQTALPLVVVMRRVRATAIAYVIGAAVALTGAVWLVRTLGEHAGLTTILAVHGGVWAIFVAGFMTITMRWVGTPVGNALFRVVRWFLPMVYIGVELPLLAWVLSRLSLDPASFVFAACAGLLHIVACLPLLWMLEKRVQGVSFVLSRLRSRTGSERP